MEERERKDIIKEIIDLDIAEKKLDVVKDSFKEILEAFDKFKEENGV